MYVINLYIYRIFGYIRVISHSVFIMPFMVTTTWINLIATPLYLSTSRTYNHTHSHCQPASDGVIHLHYIESTSKNARIFFYIAKS